MKAVDVRERSVAVLATSRHTVGTLAFLAWLLLPATPGWATDLTLGFGSLPSAQGWIYTSNGLLEPNIFSVGLNSSSEPTLFQNTLGGGSLFGFYENVGGLNPAEPAFTLDLRVAVLDYEFVIPVNDFGFFFGVAYGGTSIDVGISTTTIAARDSTGFRTLASSLDNTGAHDYELVGTMGAGGTWKLYRDQALIGQGDHSSTVLNRVALGDGTSGDNAQAEVTSFSFTQAPTPVPALLPTGLATLLLTLTLAGLVLVRRRATGH